MSTERTEGTHEAADALLALYDREMRVEIEFFDTRREAVPDVIRHVSLNGPDGAILLARFDPLRTQQVIHEQVAYFESVGQGCEWKVYAHDTQPGLKKQLLAAGFRQEDDEAVLVLEVARAAGDLLAPVTADVRRLQESGGLDDVQAVEEAVWGEDFGQLVRDLGAELRHDPQGVSFHVAYVDGRPASCAWLRFHRGTHFASLWGGSTLPEYRQRGLYTALVAVRVQEALARGVPYVTVDASPMSAPILLRYGFRQITTCTPFKWEAK